MVERRFSLAPDRSGVHRHNRIVEPELDMNRDRASQEGLFKPVSRLVRWLMPQTRLVGPPMRSVARELEEFFPVRDS